MTANPPKSVHESLPVHPPVPRDLGLRVLREHVASIYSALNASLVAHIGLTTALGAVMYYQQHRTWILAWIAAHIVFCALLYLTPRWHPGVPLADTPAWARRHVRTVLMAGTAVATTPWFFCSADNLSATSVVTVVVIGSCARSMQLLWPLKPALYAYVLPMMLSLIAALAWQGDAMHLFLAMFSLLYLLFTLRVSDRQQRMLTDSLVLRFENEALASRLGEQITAAERASTEKTRFLATASHDLRQPLHAIALFGAALENELREHPGSQNAGRLMRAVNELGTSLDTMLDISRLDAGIVTPTLEQVSVDALFRSLNHIFSAQAEQRELQLRVRASGLWVRSDPKLLYRMLSNLIDNALKYTQRGGVSVRARTRGDAVWIEVLDTGIGIAPEQLEWIFEEFYQVDNPGRGRAQGLGIGLSIVQRLSRLLDHPVQVRSRIGRGTRLRLMLPACAALEQPQPVVLRRPAGADAAGSVHAPIHATRLPGRILLIDDETQIRQAMTSLLRVHGIEVEAVTSEVEAAQVLAREQAARDSGSCVPFDLLLCDYRLSNGDNGLDVGQRLRERFGLDVPLMLITGETSPERLQRVRASGVPVLFKPVSEASLLRALGDLAPAPLP